MDLDKNKHGLYVLMGKSGKIAKLRKDKFYKLAKEAGYRSRAAFKLIQLNRKFGFLNDARVLVDLCAAPGGWLQVASNILPISSIIIGVDLVPIKPIRNVITHIGDITTESCVKKVKNELQNWKSDVVLHDGAPNLGQNWPSDAFGQAQLTLSAIKLMTQILTKRGWFVTKIFRSKDYINITKLLSKLFKHIHATKPIASRRESAEIFVVCQDYIGQKAFDASILNFKTVFQEEEDKKPPLTIKKLISTKKVNRGGYDENITPLVYSKHTLTDFLTTNRALEFLSATNEIILDKDCYKSANITPTEIKECIKDTKVLGLKEIKSLLSWRKRLIKIFGLEEKEQIVEEIIQKAPQDEEKEEIELAQSQELKETKKEVKKKRKMARILKIRNKKAASTIASSLEENNDENLFSLSSLKNISELNYLLKSDRYFEENENLPIESEKNELNEYDKKISKIQSESSKKYISHPLLYQENVESDDNNDEIDEATEADLDFLLNKDRKKTKILNKYDQSEQLEKERKVLSPEELALGAFMRESSKNKKELLDQSWNRNTKADEKNLPSWFKEYEDTHNIRTLPITKEEVEFYRQKQRELDSRPVKKVLEARARKKKKKIALLETTRAKAEKLLEGEGIQDIDKVAQAKSLYKKANKLIKNKPKKKLIVAKKYLSNGRRYSKPAGIKGPVKVVDRRMKKDKRNDKVGKKSKTRSKSKMRHRR
ncbi:hypothetical protein HZS_7747 [Henneguya salminicola]|nr:hypothetical protein HZS_7747 [Henneguya salminicola]